MNKNRERAKILAARGYLTQVLRDKTTDGEYIYLAHHPELEGCMAQGITQEEAVDNLNDVRVEYIEHLLDHNLQIPDPLTTTTTAAMEIPASANPVIEINASDLGFPEFLERVIQPDEREILYEAWLKT